MCISKRSSRTLQSREFELIAKGKKRILGSGDLLSIELLAKRADVALTDLRTQVHEWERCGEIFLIRHEGMVYAPMYGLELSTGYHPCLNLVAVIRVLAPKKDGWGMAFWLGSSNGYLGGRMPKDMLGVDPRSVVAAAEEEVSGILIS